jgi:uncharacterized protein YaeQ
MEIFAMDRGLLAALVAKLERRMQWDLSVAEKNLYITIGADTLSGIVERRAIGP